jgi:hypothetical protein
VLFISSIDHISINNSYEQLCVWNTVHGKNKVHWMRRHIAHSLACLIVQETKWGPPKNKIAHVWISPLLETVYDTKHCLLHYMICLSSTCLKSISFVVHRLKDRTSHSSIALCYWDICYYFHFTILFSPIEWASLMWNVPSAVTVSECRIPRRISHELP